MLSGPLNSGIFYLAEVLSNGNFWLNRFIGRGLVTYYPFQEEYFF